MFDTVICRRLLPDGLDGTQEWFQTKDFDPPELEHYTITADGRLLDADNEPVEIDGPLNFYTVTSDGRWHEYNAEFSAGILLAISVAPSDVPKPEG